MVTECSLGKEDDEYIGSIMEMQPGFESELSRSLFPDSSSLSIMINT